MLIAWCALALVVSTHPYLRAGEELFEAQQYAKAVTQLTLAAQLPELTRDERRHVMNLLAQSHLALGARPEAIEAFGALLAKDPHAPGPEGGPKVREAFRLAKERLFSKDFVALRRLDAAVGQVLVEVTDPWAQVTAVLLYQAPSGFGPFTSRALTREAETLRADLGVETRAYYVEATSGDGRVLAHLCSASEPCSVVRLEPGPAVVAARENTGAPAAASAAALISAPLESTRAAARPKWVNWVVSAVALTAVGVAAGLAISSSVDSARAGAASFASDRKLLDDAAIGKAWAAYVVGGVGVAAVLGATALWVF